MRSSRPTHNASQASVPFGVAGERENVGVASHKRQASADADAAPPSTRRRMNAVLPNSPLVNSICRSVTPESTPSEDDPFRLPETPVDDRLLPLSGYLYAKSIMGEAVDATQVESLADLQRSMASTRAVYSRQRGNVVSDIRATDCDSIAQVCSGELLRERLIEVLKAPNATANADLRPFIPFNALRKLSGKNIDRYSKLAETLLDAGVGVLVGAGLYNNMSASLLAWHADYGHEGQRFELEGSTKPFPHERFRLIQDGHEVISGDAWKDDDSPLLAVDTARGVDASPVAPSLSLSSGEARIFNDAVEFLADQLQSDDRIMAEQAAKAAERKAYFQSNADEPDWRDTLDYAAHDVPGRAASQMFIDRAKAAQTRLDASPRRMLAGDLHAAWVARAVLDQGVHGATRPQTIRLVQSAGSRFIEGEFPRR